MSSSLNKVMVIGRLGKDPEIRTTQSGMKIVNLTVATSEKWKDKQSGETKEQTEWFRIVIMNDNIANVAEKYLKKGSNVYIEGKLQTRRWTDQSGVDRYTTEIMIGRFDAKLLLLSGKGEGGGGDGGERRAAPAGERAVGGGAGAGFNDSDEIPFAPQWQ